MNLARNLENAARHFPKKTAVSDKNRKLNFHSFSIESDRIASALGKMGILPGDHVGLCAANSVSWMVFYFGVLKAGAVAVTISNALTLSELTRILENARP